jgi:DNA-binding MarR family transcriptional regulator
MKKQRSTGLLRALRLTAKTLSFHIHERFLAEGIELTRPQFVLLKVLYDEDGRSQNDLAFITERDKTSMARLVTSMEKKGLVVRKTDKHDLRKKMIYLTTDGRQLLNKAWPIMEEIEYNLSIDLKPEDVQTTLSTIKKIQAKVLSTNGVKL